ncbi:PH domain-containing protein [Cytobacillus sp. FSL W7-1323]|uniref:PH domain-containing protein n=1 Tax=Cytobacillus sp. FSL W7-1323 TaxID=2921700 RepID=UPI003159826D
MGLFSKESPEDQKAFYSLLNKWTDSIVNEKTKGEFAGTKTSMLYTERSILNGTEKVLAFIEADYYKKESSKIAGVLLITDQRLLYAHKDRKSQFKQEWKINKINGIKESGFPLKSNEFQLDIGKSKIVFSRIRKKDRYKHFIQTLQEIINNPSLNEKSVKKDNKYTLLEQISDLKTKGILTEEEFQQEKEKILNS